MRGEGAAVCQHFYEGDLWRGRFASITLKSKQDWTRPSPPPPHGRFGRGQSHLCALGDWGGGLHSKGNNWLIDGKNLETEGQIVKKNIFFFSY